MSDPLPQITLPDGTTLTPWELRESVRRAGAKGIEEIKLLEVMVSDGVCALADLPGIIGDARTSRQRIAMMLVQERRISEEQLASVLARTEGLEVIDLADVIPDPALVGRLDPQVAQRMGALPIREEAGRIIVAVSDPESPALREDLPRLLGAPVELRVAQITPLRVLLGDLSAPAVPEDDVQRPDALAAREEDIRAADGAGGRVVQMINGLIAAAQHDSASDIHIEPGRDHSKVRMRIDGILTETRHIPSTLHDNVISRIKVMSQLKLDERRAPQDGRFSVDVGRGPIDIRVAIIPTIYGEMASLRLLDPARAKLGLDELGFTGDNLRRVTDALSKPWGAVVITGPTGSGKTTTLYAATNVLDVGGRKVVTVEDPVEQRLDDINQIQVNERAKLTFATALRSILRSDPDVILVGEIRDRDTAEIAVQSALTGHMVLTSLHTNDAVSAVSRLMEMGVEPFLISNAVDLVVAQRLVRRLCPACRTERTIPAEYLIGAKAPAHLIDRAHAEGGLVVYEPRPSGCGHCAGRGYRGRTGVHEVLSFSPELKIAITTGQPTEELREIARAQGMTSLRDDCFEKVALGLTSLEELARAVM